MHRIERPLLLLTRAAAILGVLFLLMIAGLSVLDIVFRELTGRPIRGATDIAGLLTVVVIASCFPAGLLERRQIKVAFLGPIMPRQSGRVLEVFGALMTGLMFLAIAYYVTLYAQRLTASQEYSMVLNLPIAPWWWVACACFWVCVPAQLFVIVAEALGHQSRDHEA
ncbi:TRAP transporter small permease [Chachezhania sediminis]|uniref:TRAP transporter small permease n=1 Tax=Chachezhania sediminis TaxID=2599291 RepID=UPI00131D96E8|nr:TRAP transporter small permease subunit [Chachezhania sediminis]